MPLDLKRYDVPGHVHFWTLSCFRRLTFFWNDALKQVVIDGLQRLQREFGVCLVGYVIMPEHIHVLIYPHRRGAAEPTRISVLLHAFKRYVTHYGKEALRDLWRRHHRLWSDPLNRWAHGEYGRHSIWNKRGYDFNVYRLKTLLEKLDYCHRNPITRELVDLPEQWPWSSYRFYEMQDRSVLAMDWDGQWPILW
ncbi:MAG: transposase [Phycisphaerae bacterium]|nr:transposase [Phycisphaerae bacterium]